MPMPHRHYPPAFLRYLRARLLWNLKRPGFWATGIFLSVVGLVTWQYWSNPDIFVYKQKNEIASQKPAESDLSAENRAIAADIDNLPVLFNDFEQATLSATANTPKENTQGKKSNDLLDDIINKQKSATDTKLNPGLGIVNGDTSPAVENPFVVKTENLLRTGTVDSNNQFLGLKTLNAASEPTGGEQTSSSLGIGFTNQTNNNQNSLSISPQQAALNQSINQKLSNFNGTTTQTNASGRGSDPGLTLMPPINSLPSQNSLPSTGLTGGTGYTSTGTNLPQNPYNNLNSGQVVPNLAPVTPPVTSVAPTNIPPYSSQSQSQGVVAPTTPVGYGNYGMQQPTQLPQSYGNYGMQQPTQLPQSYGNYGMQQPTQLPQSYGNYGMQQPTQLPQSNYQYLRQLQQKYTGNGQR